MDQFGRSQSTLESSQKLELFISCRSLANMDTFSKSDPYVIFYIQRNNHWFEYGRTEMISDNLNPNFQKSFIIDYHFETKQPLKFVVFDDDGPQQADLIGACETTLGAIAGAKDQVQVLEIKDNNGKKNGKLIVRADQVQMINDQIIFQLKAQKLPDTRFFFWHTTSPFFRIYRQRKETDQSVLVYESEHVSNSRDPIWRPINIKAQKLCNGDYLMQLVIQIWDYRSSGDHLQIAETTISVNEMKSQKNLQRQLKDPKKQNAGTLVISECSVVEKPSFFEYLQGGTQINLIVAIDFTGSNGNPTNSNSLHFIDPRGALNQYQIAIQSVGEILLNYDYDQKIPVYGFGCKVRLPNFNSGNDTLHCFPLNGNPQDAEVFGLDAIMQTYYNTLRHVQLDGPTYFNPIITESMKIAQLCKDMASDSYFVLLILTDGEIHDMKPVINSVVRAAELPLSIIIIGVGNADFTNMNTLDGDDVPLVDDMGRKTKRDLVQFVPFNEYKNNPELLAKNVLYELPDQLVDYMTLVGKKPNAKKNVDMSKYGFDGVNPYPAPNQGFPPPNQGYPPPNQGFPPPNQGFQQPNQGFQQQVYPQQGFPSQNQGYPPPQNYPSQTQIGYQQYPQQPMVSNFAQNMAKGGFMSQHLQNAQQ